MAWFHWPSPVIMLPREALEEPEHDPPAPNFADMAEGGPLLEVPPTVKVKVGEQECLINVKKIPYFAAFTRFHQLSSGQTAESSGQTAESSGQTAESVPVHSDIPFITVISECLDKGVRRFFRMLPLNLEDYHTVCETLDFLAVDVLKGQKLEDVIAKIKRGKATRFDDGRILKGLRPPARDAAFRLLYLFIMADFKSEEEDSEMAFDATLFVVSQRTIFRYPVRKMLRAAFEERFVVSDEQQKALDQWKIDKPKGDWRAGDTTSDEEPEDFYSWSDYAG